MKPVLEAMLHQFPFRVRGFHSDNGSEFLNYRVARLLDKMRVEEFTKSRAHRSTDNALVEGKNGAVVRKHIGHEPIAAEHAEKFQRFYTADFNPYLNYHRPCGFATVETASNGKRRRRYRLADYRPCEKLLSLDAVGLEARDHGCFSAATSPPDERHRVRLAHAATQEKTARRLPLATLSCCLEPRCAPDRTVRDSTGREGEGEAQETFGIMPSACSASPSPLTPLPARTPRRHRLRKEFFTPPSHPFQLRPISGSLLDWKMLCEAIG